jgi:sec-independent protein translocase protein TatA
MRCKRPHRDYTSLNHTTTTMGPIGMPEMIMIFVVILLLFGAKKLPELARGIGKSMGEFKKAKDEFEHEITRSETEARVKEVPGKEPRES